MMPFALLHPGTPILEELFMTKLSFGDMARFFAFLCGALLFCGVSSTGLDVGELDKDGGALVNVKETRHGNNETVSISVQLEDIERGADGKFKDASEVKVNFKVSVIGGIVHVNGAKAQHGAVTAFHLYAEIDVIGKDKETVARHTIPVLIRILVIEKVNANGLVERLVVQEEVVEVSGNKVRQVDITEIAVLLDESQEEVSRTLTAVRITEAEIHKRPQKDDKINFYGDDEPPKKPHLPDHPLRAGDEPHKKSSLCHSFFKLPIAARLAIFVAVCLLGLFTAICCLRVFCCKPTSTGEKINLADFDDKFDYDGEFDAPPLDHKVPLEKQKLVIDVEA